MTDTPARQAARAALDACAKRQSGQDARDFFAAEKDRIDRFSLSVGPLYLDFSKQSVSADALSALCDFARACDLETKRGELSAGEIVNTTEAQPASHMALRGAGSHEEARNLAAAERHRARAFAEQVRSGAFTGATGQPIRSIIHIGIGGSDLGPRLVYKALRPKGGYPIDVHFVASVDPDDLREALTGCEPESTLVFVVSKSFTTAETRANGDAAKAWLTETLGEAGARRHLVAATAKPEAAEAWGAAPEAIFRIWNWVGGRYSVSSCVSLSAEIAAGPDRFDDFLAGAAMMDEHFLTAPLDRNAPVLMALIGYWNRTVMDRQALAVSPYARRLALFPAYLQQLEMESNGKSVRHDGSPVEEDTGAIVWGAEGPNGQHAFFQLLHQGTSIVPVDFIAAARVGQNHAGRRVVMANAIAQAEALLTGRSAEAAREEVRAQGGDAARADALAPHKAMPGGRPSTFILAEELDATALGALVALYEHKVFVQSVLWDINAYDQWGVELGKTLAKAVQSDIESATSISEHDPSTAALIERVKPALG